MDNYNNKIKLSVFLVFIAVAVFLLLSLLSFHHCDNAATTFSSIQHFSNLCGRVGAFLSDILLNLFGFISFLIPPIIFYFGWKIYKHDNWHWLDILKMLFPVIFFLFFASLFFAQFYTKAIKFRGSDIFISGFVFNAIVTYLRAQSRLSVIGTAIFTTLLFLVSCLLAFNLNYKNVWDFLLNLLIKIENFIIKIVKIFKEKFNSPKKENVFDKREKEKKQPITKKKTKKIKEEKPKLKDEVTVTAEDTVETGEVFPPDSILTDPPKDTDKIDDNYLNNKKELLLEKFNDFGITGNVTDIITGPVVTLFEFEPAPGIKLSKITSLANDLTMALKALSVRIIAPIPGKSVVGIEIPNEKRKVVFFKELIQSDYYKTSKAPLTIALGKTVDGTPYISNLAEMPHLLVAGSTGSGKSVCINTMLISILYNATAEDVRFILVDPKMLELSVYNGIPHLLLPVITDPEKAAVALRWAIGEMDRRYELLANAEVRNIVEFNKNVKWQEEKLPFIVVVIDELADLMMIAPKDVETSIARIAQKARAAGIHLILATQRPSVDVITGVIKNNLPSRIAFKVTSRADSRTILDSMGAESLLGYGDMLFIPPGMSNPVRLQGAFISNNEILKVTDYLKNNSKTDYMEDEILNYEPENNKSKGGKIEDMDEYNEPLYKEAKEFVRTLDTVSISMLQRRFKIGYNKSATFVERMEKEGLVGPPDGSKPRKVFKNN